MTKQLWIVNHYASKPGEPAIRHYSLASAILGHGWETTILAGSTQHYTGRQRVSGLRRAESDVIDGVNFRWFKLPAYQGNGVLRLLNMALFFVQVLAPLGVRGLPRPDAIIGSTVHPLAALAGLRLSRRFRVPFYFEIRDLWPETLIQMGSLRRNSLVSRFMRHLEGHLCAEAVKVVTTMPFAYEYLERQGVPPGKVVWISNGVHTHEFDSTPAVQADPFQFTYFGALGSANRVDLLIHAFSRIQGTRARHLRVIGAGPHADDLRNLVRQLDLVDTVAIEPPVPRTEVARVAAEADCLVVALQHLALYDYGISLNKLYEYMAATRPIVFAGEARGNPVALAGGGLCTDGSIESTTRAMDAMLVAKPEQLRAWGEMNRAYVAEHFEYSRLGALLLDVLAGESNREVNRRLLEDERQ